MSVKIGEHEGWGEASPLPGLSRETLDEVHEELLKLQTNTEDLPSKIEEVGPWVEEHCQTAAGQHAVATAILDGMGKSTNKPISILLNQEAHPTIPISHLYTDDERLVQSTRRGTQVVKIKVGFESIDSDVARVQRIRDSLAPEVSIRVDANGAWTEEQAAEAIHRMAPLGVHSMEEPVGGNNLEAMARLRGRGIQIALDESVRSPLDLEQIIALKAADAIVVKPMLIGTPMRAMEMMRTASEAHLGIWVTTTIDGAVGRMMAIHLAAAAPTKRLEACGLNTASWLREDIGQTPEMSGGHLDSPKASGLGITVGIGCS